MEAKGVARRLTNRPSQECRVAWVTTARQGGGGAGLLPGETDSAAAPGSATCSVSLADDGPHLLPVECAKGRGSDIALPCDREQCGRDRLVVGGLDRCNKVVRTERSTDVCEADAEALERALSGFVVVDGVLELADALVGRVDQRNVRGHGVLPSGDMATPTRRRSRTATLKAARPYPADGRQASGGDQVAGASQRPR